MIKKDSNLTGNGRFEGYCADLAQFLAKKMNYSYKIVPVADERYGFRSENGTWDGMVGELIAQVSTCIY